MEHDRSTMLERKSEPPSYRCRRIPPQNLVASCMSSTLKKSLSLLYPCVKRVEYFGEITSGASPQLGALSYRSELLIKAFMRLLFRGRYHFLGLFRCFSAMLHKGV